MIDKLIQHTRQYVDLTPDEEEFLFSTLKIKKIKKRRLLARQGELSPNFYFVVKGSVRAYYTDSNGEEFVVKLSIEEEWVGEMESFIQGTPANLTIEAMEDSDLFYFDKDILDRLFNYSRTFETYFRLAVRQELIRYESRIIERLSKTAEERYAGFIISNKHMLGRVPLKQIASYLGITPESLSRIRKKCLEEERASKT